MTDLAAMFLPLGTAQCAKSVVLPADFMTSGGAAPLGGEVEPAPSKVSWVFWAAGAVIIGGVVYWVSKGGTFLANPGLPDGVAKSKGFTARDADPRELARGTKHELEHTRSQKIAQQIALDQHHGWSFDTAMSELKSSGVARMHNGLLYVLTDDEGDTIPSDPRDPMLVVAYTLDEIEGDWIVVGDKNFPDLRSALQGWQSIEIDKNEVERIADKNVVSDSERSYGPWHKGKRRV